MFDKRALLKFQWDDLDEEVRELTTMYLKSSDSYFLSEIVKFSCPFRLISYLSDLDKLEVPLYEEVCELYEDNEIDIFIDHRERKKFYNEHEDFPFHWQFNVDKFIENTPHLDKYGN